MQSLIISPAILEKLQNKHKVSRREIEQCFGNRLGQFLVDENEDHQTDPASLWFIAQTNYERSLKIIFVFQAGNIYVKSAYEPSQKSVALYTKLGK